jgi:hypothetical protein
MSGDPFGMIFGGLGAGREDEAALTAIDYMEDQRERLEEALNEARAEQGLEPIGPPDELEPLGFGEAARGNLKGFFTGSGAERRAFERSYDVPEIYGELDDLGYTDEEKQEFLGAFTARDLTALRLRRPRAFIMAEESLQGLTPEGMDQARRKMLGLPEPRKTAKITQGTRIVEYGGDEEAELLYDYPSEQETDLAPAFAKRIDEDGKGEEIWGTNKEVADHMRRGRARGEMWTRGQMRQSVTTTALDPQVQRKVVDASIALMDEYSKLKFVESVWDPNYLTIQGKIQKKFLSFLNSFGATSPEQEAWLIKLGMGEAAAASAMNATIKRITGAQMGEKEATRIRLETIDPENDPPWKFKAKLYRTIYFDGLMVARNRMLIEKGLASVEEGMLGGEMEKLYSLEGVRQDLLRKATDQIRGYMAKGMDWDQASQLTDDAMMARYGVTPELLTSEWMGEHVPTVLETLQSLPAGTADAGTRLDAEAWKAANPDIVE